MSGRFSRARKGRRVHPAIRAIPRQAGIAKKIARTSRATSAPPLLDAGAERADIEAPLGHESVATTRIDAHVGQVWMERVAGRL